MNEPAPGGPPDLREVRYEDAHGGRWIIPARMDEVPRLLREFEQLEARAADEWMRIPPEKLKPRIAQWLVANADGRKRTTQEVMEGVLGQAPSSTQESQRDHYQRFYFHLKNAKEAVAKLDYALESESADNEVRGSRWWVTPSSKP